MKFRFPWFTLYGQPDGHPVRCAVAMFAHEFVWSPLFGHERAHEMQVARRFAIGVVPEVLITPTVTGRMQYGNQLSITVTGASSATPYTLTLYTPDGKVKAWDIITDGSGEYTQVYPINERGTYSATLTAIAVVDASVGTVQGV